jgi:DNA-binding XRE family transcriptional regulator
MAGHRNFNELRARMSPERQQANAQAAQEDLRLMLLEELRKAESLSQAELARRMGVSQPAIARLETQDDVQISTLQRLVQALGGVLEITARLPSGSYRIGQFQASHR